MKTHIELIGQEAISAEPSSLLQDIPTFPIVDYNSSPAISCYHTDLKPLKEIVDNIEAKFKSKKSLNSSNPNTMTVRSSGHSVSTNITLSDKEAVQYMLYIALQSCGTSDFSALDTQTVIQCLKDAIAYGVNLNDPYKNWLNEERDHEDITSLSQAASCKNLELMDFLLDNGAKVTPSVLRSISHSVMSDIKGQELIITEFLKRGVNINMVDGKGGILHGMFFGYQAANDYILFLLSKGVDPNLVDRGGRSALHNWIDKSNDLIAITLIEHGANLYLKDKEGIVPIDLVPTHATYFKSRLEYFYSKYQEQVKINRVQNEERRDIVLGDVRDPQEITQAPTSSTIICTIENSVSESEHEESIKRCEVQQKTGWLEGAVDQINYASEIEFSYFTPVLSSKELGPKPDLSPATRKYLSQIFSDQQLLEVDNMPAWYLKQDEVLLGLKPRTNSSKIKLYDSRISHSKHRQQSYSFFINSAEGSSFSGISQGVSLLSEALPSLEILSVTGGKYVLKKGVKMIPFAGAAIGAAYIVSSKDYGVSNIARNLVPFVDIAFEAYEGLQYLSAKIKNNDSTDKLSNVHNDLLPIPSITGLPKTQLAVNPTDMQVDGIYGLNSVVSPYLDTDIDSSKASVLSFPVSNYRPYTFITTTEDLEKFEELPSYTPINFDLSSKAPGFPIFEQDREDLVLYNDTIDDYLAKNSHLIKDIKKFNLNVKSPTDEKILRNLDTQVDKFIAKDRKGSVRSELPGEYLDVPLREVLEKAKSGERAAKKAKKLLLDERFSK